MFSIPRNLISSIISSFKTSNNSLDTKRQLLLDELAKLDDEIDSKNNEETTQNKENINEEIDNKHKKCFKTKGIITKIDTNYGFIDKKLYFPSDAFDESIEALEVGMKVQYLAYKHESDTTIKVIKILNVISENWGAEATEETCNALIEQLQEEKPEYFSSQKITVLGKITNRIENKIYIDTVRGNQSIVVNIDEIDIAFVPIEGDQISMMCKVQVDEFEFDWEGEILQVFTIEPLRSKIHNGAISFVNEYYGVVDNKYLFLPDSCCGFKPSLNNKVTIDAIESDQQRYTWRCLKVVLCETESKNKIVDAAADEFVKEEDVLLQNKYGVVVTEKLKFIFSNIDETEKKSLIIKNTNENQGIRFKKYVFCIKKNQSQLSVTRPLRNISILIEPNSELEVIVEARSKFFGLSREKLVLCFVGFEIGRFIEVEVRDELHIAPAIGTGPISNRKDYTKKIWSQKTDFVPGERKAKPPAFINVRIAEYDIPKALKNAILDNDKVTDINEAISRNFPRLENELSRQNYVDVFDGLLHLEEIQLFHIFRKFDMDHGTFHHEKEYLALKMPNIAESRPSIVLGDFVSVTNSWSSEQNFKSFQGFVHKVLNDRILLKFNSTFHQNYNGEGYKIIFYFSRSPFRKQHHALRHVAKHLGSDILFPSRVTQKPLQLNVHLNNNNRLILKSGGEEKEVNWINKDLNHVQQLAIMNILRGEARPMPYVIFGPPGTGKTITLIEAIIQISTLLPYSRLLVGTPSNSSANLITERIIASNTLEKGQFIRIVGYNAIERESIPEHLLPYCATCDIAAERTKEDNTVVTSSGVTLNCRKTKLGQHRITIGTCQSLGALIYMGFAKDHFTHVIVDEAGQCFEPEIMIPTMFLSPEEGQLILAGDPMQLGPIVISPHALTRGLGTSFLSRVLDRYPYQRDVHRFKHYYDSRLVTKLIYNYRSLPSILKLFSDMFYNSELIPSVSDEDSPEIEIVKRLRSILPNPESNTNCSVYMYGIRGQNMQTPDSPSWFNTAEAKSIFITALKLFKNGLTADDIGIITPYNQQVKIIRKLFEEAGIKAPKVGSIEEFQGQERQIILLSTVRSASNLVKLDNIHYLGFVQNSKRLNVAISRARSILMIFGNPHLLTIDQNWRNIISYCVKNNTYTGCDLPNQFQNKSPSQD